MAHAWWHRTGPTFGTEDYYDQPGTPDVAAALDWASNKAEQEGREPNWKDILAYWTTQDPSATPAGVAQMYRESQSGEDDLAEYGPSGQEEITAPPVTPVAAAVKAEDKTDKDDDIWNQIFLMSLMEEMQGGDPGQAPGVVLGGRSGGLPSMMGQFKRQQKPWWIV